MRAAAVLSVVLWAAPARAEEAQAFVERWLKAQNQGDFAAYQALYADAFRGVRTSSGRSVTLDRAKWMEDRERMFKKPMVVEAASLSVRPSPEGTVVELLQTWSSGDYKDVGRKALLLVDAGGSWRIAREEQLSSKRVLLAGQIAEVTIPAKTPEAAEAARAAFADAVELLPGIKAWPLRVTDTGVVALACDRAEHEELAALAQAIAPSAVARVVRGAPACPELEAGEGDEEHPEWPVVAAASLGKRTLAVFVVRYRQQDLGDFGRDRRGHHLVALLRDAGGAIVASERLESASDFSELEGVSAEGRKVVVTETYIDAPCDGTDKHRYKKLRRVTSIAPDGDRVRARTSDSTLERGRCDDEGYREWIRDMDRAR